MNDNNPSFGSGSNLLGGTSALARAIQSRGGVQGTQSQVSPASPNFDPNQVVPQIPPTTNGMPMQPQPQQPQGPLGQQMPQQTPPKSIILDAMSNHLKHIQKLEMMQQPQQVQ